MCVSVRTVYPSDYCKNKLEAGKINSPFLKLVWLNNCAPGTCKIRGVFFYLLGHQSFFSLSFFSLLFAPQQSGQNLRMVAPPHTQ